jgi:hypothetical protein
MLINAVALVGVAMTMVVFADNNHWAGALLLAAVLAVAIYLLGTPAHRAQARGSGRVQFNTMLGSHQVDLRKGFEVKRGYLGGPIVKVRRKRYRINGGLGAPGALREWLDTVCAQD